MTHVSQRRKGEKKGVRTKREEEDEIETDLKGWSVTVELKEGSHNQRIGSSGGYWTISKELDPVK